MKTVGIFLSIFIFTFIIFYLIVIKFILSPKQNTNHINSTSQSHYNKLDINRDGKVNYTDVQIINNSVGCKSIDPCWHKVVGKTLDGDNPIYNSDLDLNNKLHTG